MPITSRVACRDRCCDEGICIRAPQRDGNKKLVALEAEVGDAEIERQIGGRQFGSQFLFQLPLLVSFVECL